MSECLCQTPAHAVHVSTAGQLDAQCVAAEFFPPLSHSLTCAHDLRLTTNTNSTDIDTFQLTLLMAQFTCMTEFLNAYVCNIGALDIENFHLGHC